MSKKTEAFSKAVLDWAKEHGRKNLPWQKRRTPYKVWLSEIMLQQTQVKTVIPYFEKFISRYPSVKDLAKAPLDDILALWSGLGYYARARNLHKTANIIAEKFKEKFPNTLEALERLPGIGRSTAGAILAMGFNQRASILDGNVKRVLCRVHAIEEWPGHAQTQKKLWKLAEKYTPREKYISLYTQAIMDLGATLCTRSKPACLRCPVSPFCLAHQQGRAADFPIRKLKAPPPSHKIFLFIILFNGKILLEKRPNFGIWGGLWSLPETTDPSGLANNLGLPPSLLQKLPPLKHKFSHFHLDIQPILAKPSCLPPQIRQDVRQKWFSLNRSLELGIAAPVKFILKTLLN